MCGIAGIISTKLGERERERIVANMVAALNHRGPDDQCVQSDGIGTFGVARLSIIDRAAARQPMECSHRGQKALISYNGEVYNFLDIREKLADRGFVFRTKSDTEVVLGAHLYHGNGAIDLLDGMFAYAVWDARHREVVLVRDRLGIKPLFFVELGDTLVFASEPKAIFCSGVITPEANPTAILEYFLHGATFASGYVTSDRSFFRSIRSLPPGHLMTWSPDSPSMIKMYWSPADEVGEDRTDEDSSQQELDEALSTSVRSMLMGEVPIGTALSGGVDSSLLSALAAHAMEEPLTSAAITYRLDHDDPDAHHAALVSHYINNRRPGAHRLLYSHLREDTYLDDLDEMIRAFDEPHWEIRQLAMFANYRTLSRAGRTIVLTGEGADELFFGYYQKFPGFRTPEVANPTDFASAWRERLPWVERLLAPAFSSGIMSRQLCNDLIDTSLDQYMVPAWRKTGSRLRGVQCWYMHTFLSWLLMVNDRSSMAHSLEGRFPFLSQRMVSLALSLPPKWNIGSNGVINEKRMLRHIAKKCLPIEVWRDRAKAPLPVPQATSYHEQIAQRLSLEIEKAPTEIWEWLDKGTVKAMIQTFQVRRQTLTRDDGDRLTGYVPLGQPLVVRTVHLFAVLTLLRWFDVCIRSQKTGLPCAQTQCALDD